LANKGSQNKTLPKIPKQAKAPAKKRAIKTSRKKAVYAFVSILLIVCVIQALRGVYLNVTRYVVLNNQINKLHNLFVSAKDKNLELKKQIQNYTSVKGIEALARDNLKMVGKDEILVEIKQPTPPPAPKKK